MRAAFRAANHAEDSESESWVLTTLRDETQGADGDARRAGSLDVDRWPASATPTALRGPLRTCIRRHVKAQGLPTSRTTGPARMADQGCVETTAKRWSPDVITWLSAQLRTTSMGLYLIKRGNEHEPSQNTTGDLRTRTDGAYLSVASLTATMSSSPMEESTDTITSAFSSSSLARISSQSSVSFSGSLRSSLVVPSSRRRLQKPSSSQSMIW
mmetsp:Transcript_6730/g.18191  ORF Transcript_6730/g.18191 Transcript_6730/m.18191 type:complete len:213 (+) Transcript_6730:355-993(+)